MRDPKIQGAVRGALGFTAVSLVVYGTVAFAGRWLYRTLTEGGAYGFWAALYLAGAPWLLGRLLVAPAQRRRFGVLFVGGFLAYAVGWMAMYFPLRNLVGEVLASVLGPALFGLVLCAGFGRQRDWPVAATVLVLGHGTGYFAGEWLDATVRGPMGMVLWGVCHGLGYGAAIGWVTARVTGTADVQRSGGDCA